MLDKIRSKYILSLIFINIEEKQKLKIILNNKKLQERLEITLEMIKKVSGKFLVCENGISKIYLQDYGKSKLIFEGEYKDKKKIRGKEYNFDGKIIFDGEYVNNKRKKGKVYQNSSLIFEGEIINDKFWFGKMKEYNNDGYIKLETDIIDGEKTGSAKEYLFNGCLFFEGEYLNGIRNGYGKEYNSCKDLLFEGEYLNGKRWEGIGKVLNINEKLIYNGTYFKGKYWDGIFFDNGKEYQINNGTGYVVENDVFGKLAFNGYYKNGNRLV